MRRMPEEVMTVTCQVHICLPFVIIFTLIRRCVTFAVEISYNFRMIYKDGSEARPGVCNLTDNFNATKLLPPDNFYICFCDSRSSVSKKELCRLLFCVAYHNITSIRANTSQLHKYWLLPYINDISSFKVIFSRYEQFLAELPKQVPWSHPCPNA
jgi:hypothetical protein